MHHTTTTLRRRVYSQVDTQKRVRPHVSDVVTNTSMVSSTPKKAKPKRQPILHGSGLTIDHAPHRSRIVHNSQSNTQHRPLAIAPTPIRVKQTTHGQTTTSSNSPLHQNNSRATANVHRKTTIAKPYTTATPKTIATTAHFDASVVPSEIEPPSINPHTIPHQPSSRLTEVLASEQADLTIESVIPPALNLAELAAQPLVAQSTAMPQSEVWWPPAEPTPVAIPVSNQLNSTLSTAKEQTFIPQQPTLVDFTETTSVSTDKLIKKDNSKHRSRGKRFGFIVAALTLFLLGGYLMYRNIPSISTRIAAIQAGVHATFPSYSPGGYSLAEPVSYEPGSVLMKFVANAGPQTFTLTQSRSGWDSSAVLTNYVIPILGKDFSITASRGLTIYATHNAAAWVNGGVLYTIKGNATLSAEQIQRIADSL